MWNHTGCPSNIPRAAVLASPGAVVQLARLPGSAFVTWLCVFTALATLPVAALRARFGPPFTFATFYRYSPSIANTQAS